MNPPLTYDELASLIKNLVGITVEPSELAHPNATFDAFGVDSLGLLGIAGELQNRYGTPIAQGAEMSRTPREFLDAVNESVKAGA
ncbi:acyl carrier protein [Catenulispora subtropica]|uniref:Acyl carrier protein n=1 Tax=Catenulispora subtropica TaxID=450798 RepID=A0ABP5E6W1_9ACTN